jgi:sugar phosphate isomerase/epimerase
MWPGLVGKGSPDAEPGIELDTMLDLTAAAEVNGVRFDGVDLFLCDPHISIDLDEAGTEKLAEKIRARGFVAGSVVAPVWPQTGGGSAMGSEEERERFVGQVRKACRIARDLRSLGVRPHGIVRIDSASGVADWAADPAANQEKIVRTFQEACDVAESFGERLAAEGEICWGGMHSWRKMVDILERVNRPATLGFQADMAHTLLYVLGYNAPEDALLPANGEWSDPSHLDGALKTLTDALRPWTIDFHIAQNDATVHGSGTHDKTGHHCLPDDPNGKLRIADHAGFWLRDGQGRLTRSVPHICWDGCMFPNEVMQKPETWNNILRAMIAVRTAHGWLEEAPAPAPTPSRPAEIQSAKKASPAARKPAAVRRKKAIRRASATAAKKRAGKSAKAAKAKPARKVKVSKKKIARKNVKAKARKARKTAKRKR